MDAPTCRLCGSAHWAREPHQFKGEPKGPTVDREAARLRERLEHMERELSQSQADLIEARAISSELSRTLDHAAAKIATLEAAVTKQNVTRTGGRPMIGDRPMTPAERKRNERARKAGLSANSAEVRQ